MPTMPSRFQHKEKETEEENEAASISVLPEGCLPEILSLTLPRDACGAAAISNGFKSAADSDAVWERFLPPDYRQVIATAISPVVFYSKKQLYFYLSDSPILLDRGYLSFMLDKPSGKKCYMLGARELSIAWQDDLRYSEWRPIPESRGFVVPSKTTVIFAGTEHETLNAYLYKLRASSRLNRHVPTQENDQFPHERKDGWIEIELGEFYCDEGDHGEVEMVFKEVMSTHSKSGVIVEGIEVRPK